MKQFSPLREKLSQCFKTCPRKSSKAEAKSPAPAEPATMPEKKPAEVQEQRPTAVPVEDIVPAAPMQAAVTAQPQAASAATVSEKVGTEPRSETPAEECAKPCAKADIPQDSILKRHFLTTLHAEAGRGLCRPTDSVLRRHHEALVASNMKARVTDEAAVDAWLETERAASEPRCHGTAAAAETPASQPQAASAAPTVKETPAAPVVSQPSAAQPATAQECKEESGKTAIPQDSVLKRHFLATLRREIETGLGAEPSDSVLKRHYAALVDSEIQRRVS